MNSANPEVANADKVHGGSAHLRQTMVDCQLRTFDVTDHAVLARMAAVPREMFLPADKQALAYSDSAIDIRAGVIARRLLAPMVLARLLQAAAITESDRVLCVGGGNGYGASIAADLGSEVIALEEDAKFGETAQDRFNTLGIGNARAITGGLASGAEAAAPFDVIIIEGVIAVRPANLLAQLGEGGRLVTLVSVPGGGHGGACRATRFEKTAGAVGSHSLFSCSAKVLPAFAPQPEFSF